MIFIRQWRIANTGDVPERNSCPAKCFAVFILGIVPTIFTIASGSPSTAKFLNRSSPEGSKTRCGEIDSQRSSLSISYGLFSSKILNR